MKYLLIGLVIGGLLSILCWLAEDSIRTRCLITNKDTTVICSIKGEKVHFYREERR